MELFLAHSHLSELVSKSIDRGLTVLGLLVERRRVNILGFGLPIVRGLTRSRALLSGKLVLCGKTWGEELLRLRLSTQSSCSVRGFSNSIGSAIIRLSLTRSILSTFPVCVSLWRR